MQYRYGEGGAEPSGYALGHDAHWATAGMELPVWNGNNASTDTVKKTGAQSVDGLLYGVKWKGNITYSTPDSLSDYPSGYFEGRDTTGFSAFNAQQLAALHAVLNKSGAAAGFSVAGLTNLSASFVGGGSGAGTIRAINLNDAPTAYAAYPSEHVRGGDMVFGNTYDGGINSLKTPVAGNYAWFTVLHEVGHALGLKHGHESGGVAGALPANVDSHEFSLMTYRTFIGANAGATSFEHWGAPQTFMMLDIAALQHMYGADYTTNSGNTVYKWVPTSGNTYVNGNVAIAPGGNRIFATVWDGGGTDTYDLSAYSTPVTVSLVPGGHSVFSQVQLSFLGGGPNGGFARGNIFNARQHKADPRSLIENAIGGSGNDSLTGNIADNGLYGGAGDDRLYGGAGNDILHGGPGKDQLYGGNGSDTASYALALAGVTANLASPSANRGEAAGDTYGSIENLTGSRFADRLTGNNANNVLEGGPGADLLYGGGGQDTASYATAKARVVANLQTPSANRGDAAGDRYSSIERLKGSAHADVLTGNGVANIIHGGRGNDTIRGGAGNDRLYGEIGNDRLYGDSGNDTIYGDVGNDTAYGGIGNDVIYGGRGNDRLMGDAGNDRLFGGEGNDTARGGTGNDRLYGEAGNDVLHGDAGIDRLYGGIGNDSLYGGNDADYLYGSTGNDRLFGGAGVDRLYGEAGNDSLDGGAGNDFLYGGAGNDRLFGGTGNDRLVGQTGNDTALGGAGNDIIYGGAGNDTLRGNAGNDRVMGDAGNDRLYGDAGNDRLYGGAGNDFVYGGAGNDRLHGGLGVDRLYGDAGNDLLHGDAGNDLIYGGAGDDDLYGGLGADKLYGGAGDDYFYGGRGNDILYGGTGTDYAYFSGKRADYVVTQSGSSIIVNHNAGTRLDGVDRLISVEYAVFSDQTLEL